MHKPNAESSGTTAPAKAVVDDDALLVAAAQGGDYNAFEAIVKKHQARIYALALGIVKSAAEAEEITQETFLSAFQNLGNFRGDAKLSTWLFRVATNHGLMRLRKKKPVAVGDNTDLEPLMRDTASPFDALSLWARDPGEALHANEVHAAVERALLELDEDDRALILLRAFEDASHEELAHQFHTTVPALKSRLHRARLLLRSKLSAHLRGHPPP